MILSSVFKNVYSSVFELNVLILISTSFIDLIIPSHELRFDQEKDDMGRGISNRDIITSPLLCEPIEISPMNHVDLRLFSSCVEILI